VYGHASQFCDPRVDTVFWKKWEGFEVQHGNEDTFKEMLRIKRSVQAQFKYVGPSSPVSMHLLTLARSTDVNFIASQAVARQQAAAIGSSIDADGEDGEDEGGDEGQTDAMAALERQARAPVGFVAASTGPEGVKKAAEGTGEPVKVVDEDEVELDL
jgi:pre-mRNA-splicing factor SYF1